MTRISLKKFGAVLVGRPYGAQISHELQNAYGANEAVEFDFEGVASLGSSFGEEVIVPFAKRQGGSIKIFSAAPAVIKCLELIATDYDLKIDFLD